MRIALLVLTAALAGCYKDNPNYSGDGGPDATEKCTQSSPDCVCLTPPGVCVQCTADEKDACTGATPACGDDNRCRECVADSECDSQVCLADGTCAEAASIIYASPSGLDQSGCGTSIGNPCAFVRAKQEMTPARHTIKLLAGLYSLGGGDGDITQNTVLAAREATITRSNNGPILTVKNGSRFEIIGGTLTNATGNGGDAIRCESGGTVAATSTTFDNNSEAGVDTDSCKIAITRSIFTRNFRAALTMGGDPAVVAFTNNLAHHNGFTSTNTIGGIRIQAAAGSKIEFNTIVDNVADRSSTAVGGVNCTGTLEARYNIIYRNQGGPDASVVQTGGDCDFSSSFVEAPGTPDNTPGFISPNNSPYDYHLSGSSPATLINAAGACIGVDLDGRKRPVGGACDLGAYERFP